MVTILLEPGGVYYDTESKMIATLKPRQAFLSIFRMRKGVFEHKETSELLQTAHWSQRNRRATNHRSHLALIPIEKLFSGRGDFLVSTPKSSSDYAQSGTPLEQALDTPIGIPLSQPRPGPHHPQWKIPQVE